MKERSCSGDKKKKVFVEWKRAAYFIDFDMKYAQIGVRRIENKQKFT